MRAPAASLLVSLSCAVAAAQQPPRYVERVDVARIIVDARVVDASGRPILGLEAGDFKVRVDGKPARVDSAAWIGVRSDAEPAPRTTPSIDGEPTGRLIVFLFQKSLEPTRIVGLMRMLQQSRDFLGTLSPDDRVAVLSFDSYLTVWTDFTSDRARLEPVLERGVLLEPPRPVQSAGVVSLLTRLDPSTASRASTIEQALELIGLALEPLPGSKAVVLFGYGIGRFTGSGVIMTHDYEPARRALVAARASVFSLDVTTADYHSLEVGLQLMSEQTGGFYARTHLFPNLAMERLAGALAGSYVLFVEKLDAARPTRPTVDVELTRRKGSVLARTAY